VLRAGGLAIDPPAARRAVAPVDRPPDGAAGFAAFLAPVALGDGVDAGDFADDEDFGAFERDPESRDDADRAGVFLLAMVALGR